jgi:hypothetical protein
LAFIFFRVGKSKVGPVKINVILTSKSNYHPPF